MVASMLLIGKESRAASTKLIDPMIIPSKSTDLMICQSMAPIERITPISRVRSSTFMPIVPVSPMLPTTAVSSAMMSRKLIRMSRLSEAVCKVDRPGCTWLTCVASRPEVLVHAGGQRFLAFQVVAAADDAVAQRLVGRVQQLGDVIIIGIGEQIIRHPQT